MNVLTDSALSVLLLEGIKYLIRWYLKKPEFSFPVKFYAIMLIALQPVSALLLALLGVTEYTIPTDWKMWGLVLLRSVLAGMISLIVYNAGLKPLKEYGEQLRGQQTGEESDAMGFKLPLDK